MNSFQQQQQQISTQLKLVIDQELLDFAESSLPMRIAHCSLTSNSNTCNTVSNTKDIAMPLGLNLNLQEFCHEINNPRSTTSTPLNTNHNLNTCDRRYYSATNSVNRETVIPQQSPPKPSLPTLKNDNNKRIRDPVDYFAQRQAKRNKRQYLTSLEDNNGSNGRKVYSYYWEKYS